MTVSVVMSSGHSLAARLHVDGYSWRHGLSLSWVQRRTSYPGWRSAQHSPQPQRAAARTGGSSPDEPQPAPATVAQPEPPVWRSFEEFEEMRQQIFRFHKQHGRLPCAEADIPGGPLLPGEQPLGLWCAKQQRRKAARELWIVEKDGLAGIPGWTWWPKKNVRKPWEQWRQEVEAFYQQYGRLPRKDTPESVSPLGGENQMGAWVEAQLARYNGLRRPNLKAEEVAALDATPGWSWGEDQQEVSPWDIQLQEVQEFVRQHGRTPRRSASKEEPLQPGEQELAQWLFQQKQRKAGKHPPTLTTAQKAAIGCLPLSKRGRRGSDRSAVNER